MDFGFGSLVDKFEERLGRRATTVLLFAIGAATLTICVSTMITQGLIPIVDFIRGVSSKTVLGLLSSLLTGILIAVASGAVFVFLVRWWVKRSVRAIVDRATALVAESERLVEERIVQSQQMSERIDLLMNKLEKRATEAAKQAIDAIEAADANGTNQP